MGEEHSVGVMRVRASVKGLDRSKEGARGPHKLETVSKLGMVGCPCMRPCAIL